MPGDKSIWNWQLSVTQLASHELHVLVCTLSDLAIKPVRHKQMPLAFIEEIISQKLIKVMLLAECVQTFWYSRHIVECLVRLIPII